MPPTSFWMSMVAYFYSTTMIFVVSIQFLFSHVNYQESRAPLIHWPYVSLLPPPFGILLILCLWLLLTLIHFFIFFSRRRWFWKFPTLWLFLISFLFFIFLVCMNFASALSDGKYGTWKPYFQNLTIMSTLNPSELDGHDLIFLCSILSPHIYEQK